MSYDDQYADYDDDRPRAQGQPHRGVMIFVFGMLGIMSATCVPLGVFGIVAWVMGKRDLALIRSGIMDREGEALTRGGYYLGIVGTLMFLLYVLGFTAYVAFIVIVVGLK